MKVLMMLMSTAAVAWVSGQVMRRFPGRMTAGCVALTCDAVWNVTGRCSQHPHVALDLPVDLVEESHRRAVDVVDRDLRHAAVMAQRAVALVARLASNRVLQYAAGAGDHRARRIGRAEDRDARHRQRRGEVEGPAV